MNLFNVSIGMNDNSVKKDISIQRLLQRIRSEIDFADIEIVDYWNSDLCAIGLKQNHKLIYVSTCNYLNEKEMMCDYDLEFEDDPGRNKINVVKEGRAVTVSFLIQEILSFFNK